MSMFAPWKLSWISSLLLSPPSESDLGFALPALVGEALVVALAFTATPSPDSAVTATGLAAAPSPSASAAGAFVVGESVAFLTTATSAFLFLAAGASGANAREGPNITATKRAISAKPAIKPLKRFEASRRRNTPLKRGVNETAGKSLGVCAGGFI